MKEKILQWINQQPDGTAFVAKDFLHLGDYDNVRKTLLRLADEGDLRRVIRGIYDKPVYSDLLKTHRAPEIDKVAQALARNYQWTIAPSGATAVNALGLSTQVPAHWSYISDGPYREYLIGKQKLSFAHRHNRSITNMSPITATVIEALKYLEKDRVSEEVVHRLASVLNENEKENLLSESGRTSQWIQDTIKIISGVNP